MTGTILLLAAMTAARAEDLGGKSIMQLETTSDSLYRANEGSLDLFGGGTLNEHDLDRLSGARVHHNGRLGLGAGGNYFFTQHFGFGGEAYTENPRQSFVDEASGSLILRFPLGQSGLAPYIFGGGGHQFDPQPATFAHGGAGLEFRFSPHVGVFVDGRWVSTDRIGNYGMARAGLRFAL